MWYIIIDMQNKIGIIRGLHYTADCKDKIYSCIWKVNIRTGMNGVRY